MVLIRNGNTDGDKLLVPWKLEDKYAKTFRYNSKVIIRVKASLIEKKTLPTSNGRKLRYYSLLSPWTKRKLRRYVGSCEICSSTIQLCVDHCHKTDIVRGVLCSLCNSWIGILESKKFGNEKRIAKIRGKLENMGRTIGPMYEYLRKRSPVLKT